MNLKHFYYRAYFDGRIKLSQPPKGDARKKNEEVNEKAFRLKNALITSTERVAPFSPVQFQKIEGLQQLKLQVQNPGLLPGIGYPHEVGYPGEFKLGFGFDHVTGLPVLPGSSVKGVLRSVFPQFKFDAEHPKVRKSNDDIQVEKAKYILRLLERLDLDVPADSDLEAVKILAHALDLSIFCGWDFSNAQKPVRSPMSNHDVFFDALPVDFEKNQLLGRDALTPHGDNPLKNPIPLPFVKVMPGVTFGFYFRLHPTTIGTMTITTSQKRRLFSEILCTVGAGAKTNVGYGQFLTLNVDDRLPVPASQGTTVAAPGQPNPTQNVASAASTATKSSQPTKLQYNKSLVGKKVIGEVVSEVRENPVRFRVLNVEGFEGERAAKVPESLLAKFTITSKFNLTVTESRPEQHILNVKVEDFIPRT